MAKKRKKNKQLKSRNIYAMNVYLRLKTNIFKNKKKERNKKACREPISE